MTDDLPKFEAGKNYLLSGKTLNQIMAAIRRRTPLDGGVKLAGTSEEGFRLQAPASADVSPLGLDVGADGVVVFSTVLYAVPQINDGGWTALNATPTPALALTGSGTEHVVVQVTGTFDITSDGTFVRPVMSGISVKIAIDSAPGPSDMISTTGTFKFLLATFVDGIRTGQTGHGPIVGKVCDDLSGAARGQLDLTWTGS